MFGFIVTTHFNNYETISKCLNLLFSNVPPDSIILLYVNETTDNKVLNIKNEYADKKNNIIIDNLDDNNNIIDSTNCKFEVFYIKDQLKNNGLTGTWNLGIKHFINNYKQIKFITILGHDTFLNDSINFIYERAIESVKNNKLQYFGPLYKYWKNKKDELWQDEKYYKNYKKKFLIGSLLCIPLISLLKNKLPNEDFFDNAYPFGYNDIDWYNRFIKNGGEAIIVEECIIDHQYNRSWIAQDPRISNANKKQLLNNQINENEINKNQINENEIEFYFNKFNLIKQKKFNWQEYSKKNFHLKLKNEIDAFNHYMTKGKYNIK